MKELAAEQSEACIRRLIELRDHAESEQVRFAAAKELLDRACGRPRQEIAVEDKNLTITISQLTPPPAVIPSVPVVAALIDGSLDLGEGDARD